MPRWLPANTSSFALGRDAVLPAFLPLERRVDELLERYAFEQVLQRPPLRRVGDHEYAPVVELGGDVREERAHLLDALAVALAAGKGLVDEPHARVEPLDGAAVQLAVVALTQALVLPDLDAAAREGDLRRFDRTSQVGGEDARNPVVTPPLAQPPRKQAALLGEPAGQPASGEPTLVVLGDRVGLVHKLQRHARSLETQRLGFVHRRGSASMDYGNSSGMLQGMVGMWALRRAVRLLTVDDPRPLSARLTAEAKRILMGAAITLVLLLAAAIALVAVVIAAVS